MDPTFSIGDTVLICGEKGDQLVPVNGEMFRINVPRGAIDTGRIVGMAPGDLLKVGRRSFKVLRPDTLDHLNNLNRGPQMILPKDSSRIVSELGIGPGSRVIEGGAGSGALTIALLNAVGETGSVTTYELRKDHLLKARSNIERTGFADKWTARLGNIYEGAKETDVDAFVVDVPEPERTAGVASGSLRIGGRFCSYVPTTNQMERVFVALRSGGFTGVKAIELMERGYSVKEGATRPVTEMLSHTGFLISARWMGSG